ncbi:MAG: recombination regulator RecX [Lachnospiraceae bacterium]|nr:recombination regulator RecX [Lachnospiraceae bacterium]
MQILSLKPYRKNKVQVFLQEEKPAFVLYQKEVEQYGLKEGGELTESTYAGILEETLKKRARNRALYLLARQARTEWQLRKKLEEGFYPEEAVEEAISYVKGYRYLDDAGYAENFAEVRTKRKSRRMVEAELLKRGIPRETVDAAMESLPSDEKDTIRSLVQKKFPCPQEAGREEAQKFLHSLVMKGFGFDDCRDVMRELELDII